LIAQLSSTQAKSDRLEHDKHPLAFQNRQVSPVMMHQELSSLP